MRPVALSLVVLVLLGLGTAPLVAAGSVALDDPAEPSPSALALTEPTPHDAGQSAQLTTPSLASPDRSPPETTFVIRLQSDQRADWQITVEYDLEDQSERESFDEIAAAFEQGDADVGPDIALYERISSLAAERTDREMEIENVEHASSRQGDVGILELSFTWTMFLEADGDGDRLIFNDALQTPETDSWLASLTENQELRIHTPRGYEITGANVGFSDNTVVIEGPHTFDPDDHVRITLDQSAFGAPSWEFLIAAVVIGVAIVAGAFLLRRRDGSGAEDGSLANGGTDTVATSETKRPSTDTPPEPSPPEADLSLLSDDEQVERLLERNGGRMRQAKIVAETDWSDAKVSQLLSGMADDERIKKLRIGRENLISLPGVDALGPKPGEQADDPDDPDDPDGRNNTDGETDRTQ